MDKKISFLLDALELSWDLLFRKDRIYRPSPKLIRHPSRAVDGRRACESKIYHLIFHILHTYALNGKNILYSFAKTIILS